MDWKSPSGCVMRMPEFGAVWNAIKGWDIEVPKEVDGSGGHCSTTGNHVEWILDALGLIPEGCQVCHQFPVGQTGEFPCPQCGLPRSWDKE